MQVQIKNLKKKKYTLNGKNYKLKQLDCEICGSKKSKLFQNCGKIGDKPGQYGFLPIRICLNCSLKFISPRPSNSYYKKFFNLDYGKTYYGSKFKPSKDYLNFQKIRGQLVYNFFSKYFKKKISILDHGCGVGTTMIPWMKKKYDIKGFDPHLPSIKYGKKKFSLDLDLSFGEKLNYQNKSFDLVISLGSLEHCFDIKKCLKEIWRVLKKDGNLIIRWRSDKLIGSPLEYFGHATLKYMNIECWKFVLNRYGFKITKVIKNKVEKYDSFEYLIVKKVYKIKKKKIQKKFLKKQYLQFKKHYDWYNNICKDIEIKKKNKSFYKKNFKYKFIQKRNIGLMNLGKKKSVERFFDETNFYNRFLKKVNVEKLYEFK